ASDLLMTRAPVSRRATWPHTSRHPGHLPVVACATSCALTDHPEVAVKAKVLLVLTLANMILLAFSLSQTRVAAAAAGAQAPLLRGRALEIVDDQGRVRSTLTVIPADPTTGYPETVLFRLIDSKGRPSVKIAATEDWSALGLGGELDPTGISLTARGTTTSVKLTNKDGHERTYKP